MATCSLGRSQLASCFLKPAKILLLAALKLEYCTPEPECMATMPNVSDWVAGRAVVVAVRKAANERFLICMVGIVDL